MRKNPYPIKNNSIAVLYKYSFESSPTPTWIEDFTELYYFIQKLKKRRIKDFKKYLDKRPNVVADCAKMIVVVDVNEAAVQLHKAKDKKELLTFIDKTFTDKSYKSFKDELVAIYNNKKNYEIEGEVKTFKGEILNVLIRYNLKIEKDKNNINATSIVTLVDITKQKLYQNIVNASTAITFSWVTKPIIHEIFVSENVKNVLGYSADEFISGKIRYLNIIHPDDLKRVIEEAKYYRFIKKVKNYTHQPYRVITKNKKIRWVEDRTSQHKSLSGELISYEGIIIDITDRYLLHEKAKIAEHIISTSPAVAFVWKNKKGWPVQYVSDNVNNLLGYSSHEFLTDSTPSYDKLVHPEDIKRVTKEVNTFSKDKNINYFEHKPYRIITKKGKIKFIEDRTFINRDKNGKIISYQGILLDVTERITTQNKLRDEENKFRHLVEKSLVGVYVIQDDKFPYVNPKIAEIFGYKQNEIINQLKVSDFVAPKDRKNVLENIRQRIENRTKAINYSFKGFKKDNTIFDVEVYGTGTIYNNKPAVIGTLIDISERKTMEQSLKESEKHYKDLFNLSPTSIVIIDHKMKIYELNDAFCASTGYLREELLGKHIGCLTKPSGRAEVRKHFNKIIKGKILKHEVINVRKDGSERIVRLHERSFKFSNGSIGVLSVGDDITEQKLSEKILKESEEKFKNLTENTNSGIFIIQGKKIVYVNPAFVKITGYKLNDLKNFNFWDIAHPDYKETTKHRALSRQAGKNVTKKYELKLIAKSGNEIWIDFSATLINFKNKPAILGTGFDITKKKLIEISLKESEEKFKSLTESTNSGIFIVRGEQFVYINPAFVEITGYSEEDIQTMKFRDVVHPDHRQMIKKHGFARQTGKKVAKRYEFKIITKQANEKWVDFSATKINFMGRPSILGTMFDITEKKTTEEKLKEQYQKNEQILKTTLDGFILADQNGVIIDVNEPYCKMIKYSKEEILGMNIRQIEGHHSAEEVSKRIKRVTQQGHDRFETVHIDKSGDAIDLDVSISLMVLESETYIAAFVRNIRERKLYEKEILENQNQLRELASHLQSIREEERKLLARELHDELGQILTAAKIDLNLLEKSTSENKNELKEITNLVNEGLLSTKRLATQLRPELLQELGFIDAVREMLTKIKESTQLKTYFRCNVNYIDLDFDKSLPLYRIIQESLTNIIKHSKSDVARVQIKEKNEELIITIKDEGLGFNPELITSGCFGLLGMKERLIPLKGDIKIKSDLGVGTTVTVKVPFNIK